MSARLKCDYCDFTVVNYQCFSDASQRLFRHYLFTHCELLAEEKLICDQCSHQFVSTSNLIRHIEGKHRDQPKATLFCDVCLRDYTQMISLSHHIESAHLRDTYDCQKCGNTFDSKQQLRWHKIYRHSNKLYCENCNHWCCTKKDLFKHIYKYHSDF